MPRNKILFIILILSVLLGLIAWPNIFITPNELYEYGEEYYLKNYSIHNDTLRFMVFLSISLIPFFFFYCYFKKLKVYSIKEFLKIKPVKNFFNNKIKITLCLLCFLCLVEFALIDFTFFIGNLDLLHEGLWITSAYNYVKTNQFWQSSYIDRGLFGNYFPLIFWSDQNFTIGSVRFAEKILDLFNKIFLLILAAQISNHINFENIKKLTFFLLLSIFFTSEVNYLSPEQFSGRAFLLILFLNILIFSLDDYKKFSFSFLILGLFSVLSILWYLDIGAYINFILLFICFFFLLRKDYKIISSIISGIIIGWILFFIFINPDETSSFIFNTIKIYQTMDQIHGLIYPIPFLSGDTRSTKAVLFFVIGGIFTIFICLNKNNFNAQNKIFFIILFVLSIVYFKTALSRSDEPHIKSGTGLILLIIYTYISYYLINSYFFDYLKNLINKNKRIFLGLVFFVIIFNFNLYNIKNIKFFSNNLNKLFNANDEAYLTDGKEKYIKLISLYNELSAKDDCVQILSDETILPFLLKKKTCTKYYEIWILRPKEIQEKFIEDLRRTKPKIILKRKNTLFTPELKYVEKYVDKTYEKFFDYDEWIFLRLK